MGRPGILALFLLAVGFPALAQVDAAVATDALSSQNASAAPRLIKFSGTLTPPHGAIGVTFALYGEQTGGSPLWLETQTVTPDEKGNYTIYLGANHPQGLSSDLFTLDEARWLGVQPEGQPEQTRVLLVSVPYALKAQDADRLGGLPASAFLLNANAAVGQGSSGSPGSLGSLNGNAVREVSSLYTPNVLTKWASGNVIGLVDSAVFENGGKVGIGTTSPAQTLSVAGTIQSTAGGIMFPDGTVQKTAAAAVPNKETYFKQLGTPNGTATNPIALPTDGSRLNVNSVTVPAGSYVVMAKVTVLSAVFPNGPWSSSGIVACWVNVNGVDVDRSDTNVPSPVDNLYWRANITNLTAITATGKSTAVAAQCSTYGPVTDMWIMSDSTLVVTPVSAVN